MDLNKQLTFLDLFSGIGGFRIGMERAGFRCIGYCDNDEYANRLYKAYFNTKEELFFDDIRTIKTEELPDFDILCAGFPCQSFSIAGKRQGFKDTRGTMFFEIARILKDKRPRYFILENVKGLLSHDSGKTFQTILKILTDLGYQVQWQLLNSKFFGVPQNRERVYIVGYHGKECAGKIFPITEASGQNSCKNDIKIYYDGHSQVNRIYLQDGISPCLTACHWSQGTCIAFKPQLHQMAETNKNSQGKRIYSTDGISPCITASHGNQAAFINKPQFDHYKETDIVETLKVAGDTPLVRVRNGTKKGYDNATLGDGINLAYLSSKKRRGRVGKGCSQTLDTNCNIGTIDEYRIRRLTPLECFRLQGFPDEMVKVARTIGLSDCRLYKMAGNAVTVNVVETVAKKIAEVENDRT
ncbi:TPA: DNA (cytosine-5-)-methyltransferase [Candidatus Scatenecus faecavium]|uniref:Cytosine-specific methyltransferase n=1 Tax=Candidatus Scatenecus faecavium TaxID=2840915 RepID=A0A9D1FUA5_9BACT|nr:DNA (cytosine-5-)-methyltransferase [Candidatus Scatenecus faecavium]